MKTFDIFAQAIVILVIVCVSMNQGSPLDPSETETDPPTDNDNPINVREFYMKLEKDLKSAIGKGMRKYTPSVLRVVNKKEISSGCIGSFMQLAAGLRFSKLWAYQMLDSSGRLPEGLLTGSLASLGNFDECMNINVNETRLRMRGQVCALHIYPPIPAWKPFQSAFVPLPELFNISAPDTIFTLLATYLHNLHITTIKFGLCLPAACTLEDVNKLVQIIPEQLGVPELKFEVPHCDTKEKVEFSVSQFVSLCVFGILSFFVILGTIVGSVINLEDIERSSTKGIIFRFLKSFSFFANGKKLASYTCPEEKLNFVYGLIFFLFLWVIMVNTFMYMNFEIVANFFFALQFGANMFYEMLLSNKVLALQLMFYLSGFVTAYRTLKSSDGTSYIWKLTLKRYLRFTPIYALVIGLIIVMPTWGSGPSWYSHMTPMYEKCRDKWWYNILYINNFITTDDVCLDHTWPVAMAAQLHLIGICILILLKQRPKIGLLLNFVLVVAGLITVGLTNAYYDLPPNVMLAFLHPKDRLYYASHSYYRMYTNISLYCIGIFMGYFTVKHPNIKISKKTSTFLWLATLTGFMAALCVVHLWRLGPAPSPLIGGLYAAFSKVAGAAFICWTTVACMTGQAGTFGDVLSWQPFVFFGRLTFIAYVIHVPIQNIILSSKKSLVFLVEFEILSMVLANMAATYLVAYILHMFFEAPILSLSDVLRKRNRTKTVRNGLMTEKAVKYLEKIKVRGEQSVNVVNGGDC